MLSQLKQAEMTEHVGVAGGRKEVWVALHNTLQAAQTGVEAASAKTAVSLEVRVPLAETQQHHCCSGVLVSNIPPPSLLP